MTPRERAKIGCKTLTVAGAGSLLEEDILVNMIESAVAEERAATIKRIDSLILLFSESGWPVAATRYLLAAIESIKGNDSGKLSWNKVHKEIEAMKNKIRGEKT